MKSLCRSSISTTEWASSMTDRSQQSVLITAGSKGSDRYNRAMFATDKNNFMPRFGFAYKLGPKTVVRLWNLIPISNPMATRSI
jgi:hypothetical protein